MMTIEDKISRTIEIAELIRSTYPEWSFAAAAEAMSLAQDELILEEGEMAVLRNHLAAWAAEIQDDLDSM